MTDRKHDDLPHWGDGGTLAGLFKGPIIVLNVDIKIDSITIIKEVVMGDIFNIRESLGPINTGFANNIISNVHSLNNSGEAEVAKAFAELSRAVSESNEIADKKERLELLDQITTLSEQANAPEGERRMGTVRLILQGLDRTFTRLATAAGAAGGLAAAWHQWGSVISAYFGAG